MSEMREALGKLRRPFDKKHNDILDQVLLFLPPFEVLEARIEELEKRIEDIEDYRDAKEELREYKAGRDERSES